MPKSDVILDQFQTINLGEVEKRRCISYFVAFRHHSLNDNQLVAFGPDICLPMRDLVPFLSLAFLAVGDAHVALTFPEARYPPLDFLDTSRTSGPCGVPVPRRR
ncbi:hypothetical protein ANCDUO_26546 [Ancylostoma duodenale]|uniref:Uncharacterized protein n=1 Tax=Ancylostoma duodenale TaxID=51022 RepID=A0A0C2C1K4_9BILA|nr:hypothetical protein ANCDUO_26546 [Ancylostoma duodenale]